MAEFFLFKNWEVLVSILITEPGRKLKQQYKQNKKRPVTEASVIRAIITQLL